jgi:hypothetical protein
MLITKLTARRGHMIAASSLSSDDDVSLGADQEEACATTHDVASSSVVPQCRGGVLSQRGQFSPKYKAHSKDDLSI